ncbi:MAG: single-stranded-DNA-specific exonuclease RecJ [Alphaproteobacteria bacterium]|nr:single-stranded-DNA-specific exonuclease RecJ [Alphaproteobacteria bacterium]MBP7757826.1 single-stranded-DNA-specific exonuclease RecJ [Alphaproteobacteria bacterium]MBP7760974.1 single-stranded-DNA-specific exonuclease RecJ [Alphaproteobacteria bacterium]MBP7905302.1 single-stranded-DNA-specific exonuclease RecJ [Alphaproteobacteria bacterium]
MTKDVLVEESLLRSRWVLTDSPLDEIEKIARVHGLPEIIARLLCTRGIAAADVPRFLRPTLKDHFPDPFTLKGMSAMADDVVQAIEAKAQFAIFGDFDVDGATSSAILYRLLKHLGFDPPVYIPDRVGEGYGPNIEALKTLSGQGADILFMLDCGTTAFDIIKAGTEMGLKIIILDHHEAEDKLPEAWHVINPKRKDDTSGLTMLAACGVTFLTCVAISSRLRERGWYSAQNLKEPDLKSFMDILALGTVCDMVPLTGPNRLFVRTGFSTLANKLNTGISALMEVARIKAPITTYDAGFVLGPRINAGSRVHKADLGARLLCTDNPEEAKNIAWTLDDCNKLRKEMQLEMEEQAMRMVEDRNLQDAPIILVDQEGWHPGLSGLVAGNLKEKYGRPACVVAYAESFSGQIEGRGSGRSIPGIHIANAFIDARAAGWLEKGGGHAMAGGFTVLPEKMERLRDFLYSHISAQQTSGAVNITTSIDGVLSARGVTVELVTLLQDFIGPFGQEHPEPIFALTDMKIHSADIVGEKHVRLLVSDREGGPRVKAMAFRTVGSPMGEMLLSRNTGPVHLAATLKINEWQGRQSAEIIIQDAAPAKKQEAGASKHRQTAEAI